MYKTFRENPASLLIFWTFTDRLVGSVGKGKEGLRSSAVESPVAKPLKTRKPHRF